MLLYTKPLTEIAIGESFQVTVTWEDWEQGICHDPGKCAVANALTRTLGVRAMVSGRSLFTKAFDPFHQYVESDSPFSHDGLELVLAFDLGKPFPGETIVTFTRES